MRAFITGIEGFVGYYLARHLLEKGWDVSGGYLDETTVRGLHELESIKIEKCDINDASELKRIMNGIRPDVVFHLAAVSFVPQGGLDPGSTFRINVLGSINLLEAVRSLKSPPRVVFAGSAEIYGAAESASTPLTETVLPSPKSLYGVSKYSMELAALRYMEEHEIDLTVTRSFNHTGPRQRSDFAASSFARQIAGIERGAEEPILHVGNLDSVRDFTDVRDVVAAYAGLGGAAGVTGVFNVCSGKGVTMRWILDYLVSLSHREISVETDMSRMRKADIPVLVGSSKKLAEATGWEPTIRLSRTLEDLLDWWRRRLKQKQPAGVIRGGS